MLYGRLKMIYALGYSRHPSQAGLGGRNGGPVSTWILGQYVVGRLGCKPITRL